MPFENMTNTILTEEYDELQEIIASNPEAKKTVEQFEAKCKNRKALSEAKKSKEIIHKSKR